MKKILFYLLAALIFAGCNKQGTAEEEDAKPAPTPAQTATPSGNSKTAAATPGPNDWMWKTSKGKPRNTDPLKIKDEGLDSKRKK